MSEFSLIQRGSPVSGRYAVEDRAGGVVCQVRASNLKLRSEITLRRADAEETVYATVQARKAVDLSGLSDVRDGDRHLVGSINHEGGLRGSLRRSWEIRDVGGEPVAAVKQDATGVAKTLWSWFPGFPPATFAFTGPDGQALGTAQRRLGLRSRYEVDVPGVDERLVIAVVLGLDLLDRRRQGG